MRGALLAAAAVAAVVLGLTQLRLEADIFGLLPTDIPVIQALNLHADAFGASNEAVISVQAGSAGQAEATAASLASALAPHAASVVWRNPLREDAAARAELMARLWFSADAEALARLERRIIDERAGRLARVRTQVATSFSPEQIGRLMQDPFGFLEIARGSEAMQRMGEQSLFSAVEGRFRLMFVAPPVDAAADFRARGAWIAKLRDAAQSVATQQESVRIRVSGRPALNAELGNGMVRDMQLAAGTTLVLVALLFFFVYRRWGPLLWLLGLLGFIVAATVALGGLLFGGLNAISLGFAAILLGLSAGYGLLLYQEYLVTPGAGAAAVRRRIGPSILWASATTAGAFLMVGRSSLPGMVQLGVLVALGIMLAGAVMVAAYLWPLRAPEGGGQGSLPGLSRRGGLLISLGLLLLGAVQVGWSPPAVDASTRSLGPRDGEARSAMAEIDTAFGRDRQELWILLGGADQQTVAQRLAAAEARLSQARARGAIVSFALPTALWPQPPRQAANRATLERIIQAWPAATRAVGEAGFADSASDFGTAIIAQWRRLLADPEAGIESPSLGWLQARFMTRHGGEWLALGQLDAGGLDAAARAEIDALAALPGVTVAGWPLASRALLETMAADTTKVLLPMLAALLLLLGLAYRRLIEVVLSLVTLAFSGLLMLAVMSLAGWSWNLMNIMALPLLLGVAVDYSIHVQLALQRHQGAAAEMRRTVGRAILLAGATTVIGFASLGLASNAGLASLGLVCASGVGIACLTSVFLLPIWWQWLRKEGL